MNAIPPGDGRPPEYALALELMRVVHGFLEAGGSPLVAMMALIRAQESLVGMMAQVLKEAGNE